MFHPKPASPLSSQDPLNLMTGLFLIGEMVKSLELEQRAPLSVIEARRGLGLIADPLLAAGELACHNRPVSSARAYLVSGRWSSPEGAPIEMASSVVYPAVTVKPRSRPRNPARRAVRELSDLRSGSASRVTALVAARNQLPFHRRMRHSTLGSLIDRALRRKNYGGSSGII